MAQTTEKQKTRVYGTVQIRHLFFFIFLKHLPHKLLINSIRAFTYCSMLRTCCLLLLSYCYGQTHARLCPLPQPHPALRTPHTGWVLTRKRTTWRALVEVFACAVWAQGELGVLSVVRLDRWSLVPLSWASWQRYSSLLWRPSWRESRDWSCSRSMEPSRIMDSTVGEKTKVTAVKNRTETHLQEYIYINNILTFTLVFTSVNKFM